MTPSKACGLAVIGVVIIPILLGVAWPTGTETVDVWEVGRGLDLSQDIATDDVPVWTEYDGPINMANALIYSGDSMTQIPIRPVATTSQQGTYPNVVLSSTTQTGSTVALSDFWTAQDPHNRIILKGGFSIIGGDGTIYNFGCYWPALDVLTLYKGAGDIIATNITGNHMSKAHDLTLTPVGNPIEISSYDISGYTDITEGYKGFAVNNHVFRWGNGYHNSLVEIWFKIPESATGTAGAGNIDITYSNGSILITNTDTDESKPLGTTEAYPYVAIVFDSGKVSVSGLIDVENFADTEYAYGHTLEWDSAIHDTVLMEADSTIVWMVKRTVSDIGTAKGILDAVFKPETYYPTHSWQVSLTSPAAFGTAIKIGSMTYPISADGQIEITNISTSEQTAVPIRGMKILSLVLDGNQEIRIEGIPVISTTPQDTRIELQGGWWVSVILSQVTQTQATNYVWDVGSFGFDKTAFCGVGLCSCVAVAIVGGLYGRGRQSNYLPLLITMGICAAAYLVML